jgi:hypothetical protein
LNDDPLTAPLTCPDQLTEVELQVPLTSDPDCVSTIDICMVSLLDEAIVPFHVPAMFIAVPPDTEVGAPGLPAHAETLTTKQTSSATRIVPSLNVTSREWLAVSGGFQLRGGTDGSGLRVPSKRRLASLATGHV